jgi:hypothetical protein
MTRLSRKNLWLPAAAAAFVAVIAWWGASATIGFQSQLRCCVFDPGTGGGLGLVQWARQLGIPVRALQDPLWEAVATEPSRTGNCFLTAGDGSWSPWGEELAREDWAPLQNWIARGNSLIVITNDPSTLPKILLNELWPADANTGFKVGSAVPATLKGGVPDDSSHAKPRKGSADDKGSSEDEEPEFGSYAVAANPTTSTAALPGEQMLTVRADGPRWPKPPKQAESARDVNGVVWIRKSIGKGSLYVLLDDFAWTNLGFDADGNAKALAALLSREVHGGVFGFDEYRHGHGRAESFAVYLLRLRGAGTFCLIAVLLAGIYLLGRNIRFGAPEPYVVVERRSAQEYVEAAAFLNQRARAAPLAVESIVRRLRSVGLKRGHLSAEMADLLQQADRVAASAERPAKPTEICDLVRRMIALRKKLYGS